MKRTKFFASIIFISVIFSNNFCQAANKPDPMRKAVEDRFDIHIIPGYYADGIWVPVEKSWKAQKPNYMKSETDFAVVEFAPYDQHPNDIRDSVTVMISRKVFANAQQYLDNSYQLFKNACGKNFASNMASKGDNFLFIVLACGSVADKEIGKVMGLKEGQGQIVAFKVYDVKNAVYVVNRAWRGKSFNVNGDQKDWPANDKQIAEYFTYTSDMIRVFPGK